MEDTVYIILAHIEKNSENEFIGIFTDVVKSTIFCEDLIDKDKNLEFSKLTVHPIKLNEAFDYASFEDKVVVCFEKNSETGILELQK
jgi:hypothetical protein